MIVDDHQIILDSLALLFDMMEGLEVIQTQNDPRKVMTDLERMKPDVLLVDYSMPYMNGVELTLQVKETYPALRVLMLTVEDQADSIQDAYRAGVSGYVMKKADRHELEQAVRAVSNGQLYFSNEVMRTIMLHQPVREQDDHLDKVSQLTKRELEIIGLIAQELSTQEIADALFISVGTVETHRHNIMRKLDVKNVVGLVKFAIKYNLT